MPYPELMIAPMRDDLVRVGFTEMKTPEEVDAILGTEKRTTLVAVNSVCGCAAAMMRPAVAMSLEGEKKPEVLTTVFAGQDLEATDRTRDYITGFPPSSPSISTSHGSGFGAGRPRWLGSRYAPNGTPQTWQPWSPASTDASQLWQYPSRCETPGTCLATVQNCLVVGPRTMEYLLTCPRSIIRTSVS